MAMLFFLLVRHQFSGSCLLPLPRAMPFHSVLAFWYSSDTLPPPAVEQVYLDAIAAARWPNPWAAAASDRVSPLTGPTAVKMSGPYSWVPPVYWLQACPAPPPSDISHSPSFRCCARAQLEGGWVE